MRMMRATAVIAGLGWWALGNPSGAAPPSVPLISQQAAQWCWAASAEMVLGALASQADFSQGRQVERLYRLKTNHCSANLCTDGYTLPECDRSGFPQFYKYGLDAEVTRPLAHLDWKELATELQCRPVAFAWENRDEHGQPTGNGHMVVFAAGAFVTLQLPGGVILPLGPWLLVNDPLSILVSGTCQGNQRVQSYADYRRYRPWIHYYGFRDLSDPYSACELAAGQAEELSGGPEPVYRVLESFNPDALIDRFLELLNAGQEAESVSGVIDPALDWLRSAAGLEGRGIWTCDNPIVEEALSISALRAAEDRDALGDLVFDVGRRRYLCSQVPAQIFSIEVAKAQSGAWQIATIGDVGLASAIQEARRQLRTVETPHEAETLREVYIQGLNLKFLRDPGTALHRVVVPLSPVEGFEPVAGAPMDEAQFLTEVRRAASSFVSNGPS